jgi:hypothetical protein
MVLKLIFAAIALFAGYLIIQSFPDFLRYMRIRSM